MPLEYYNIEQLAPLLNFSTRQLQRFAERDEIPARRIGGEWRFSRQEVIGWLEKRIRIANEEGLIDLEDVLKKLQAGLPVEDLPVADLMNVNGIQVPLEGRSVRSVIENLVAVAFNTGLLWSKPEMEEAVFERENMSPTAMENGVALLHPRRPMTNLLADPFVAFGRTPCGVPFTNSRGIQPDLFFLICSTNDTQHLRTLARLSRILNAQHFLDTLRTLEDPRAILTHFRQAEEELK